jgi:hypothetical protein
VDGKLPRMPTSFAKLLEPKFSHFAKIERMPISFGKLLEMLLITPSILNISHFEFFGALNMLLYLGIRSV